MDSATLDNHIIPNSRIDLRLRKGRTSSVRPLSHGNPVSPSTLP